MTAEPRLSTDKKGKKRFAGIVFKAGLALVLLLIVLRISLLIIIYINDYCYLESQIVTREEVFESIKQQEESKKVEGWEERLEEMKRTLFSEPEPDPTLFHSLIILFCEEPDTH